MVNMVLSSTFPKIHFEPDNWTADMKRVKMTTQQRGLKIKIDFTNLDVKNYLTISYIHIRIEIRYEEIDFKDYDYVELENYVIPPSNTTSIYRDINLQRSQSLGKWSLRLAYTTYKNWEFTNQIEPYPFEFRVVSEQELQKAIAENPSAPIINIYLPEITIISVGSITAIALAIWNNKRKRRR